ncbi:unnamed protein product [Mucor hiemalis]
MKMTELEVDENERPLYPPRIKSTEVVLNPFDDIIPRISAREKKMAKLMEQKKLEEEQAKKKKKGLKKQLNLLSFGEETEEFESPVETKKTKMKSTYDFMDNVVPTPKELVEELKKEPVKIEEKVIIEKTTIDERLKEKVKKAAEEKKQKPIEDKPINTPADDRLTAIEKLKQDIRNISKPQEEEEPVKKKEKKKSLVELEREKYASKQNKKKKKSGDKVDDSDVFNKLMAFQKKISTAKPESTSADKKEQKICKLHDIPNYLKGKDLMQRKETVDDYVVIDPRDREAKAKQEEYEKKRHIKSKVAPAFRKRERDDDVDDRSRKYSSSSSKRYDDSRRHNDNRDDRYNKRR